MAEVGCAKLIQIWWTIKTYLFEHQRPTQETMTKPFVDLGYATSRHQKQTMLQEGILWSPAGDAR